MRILIIAEVFYPKVDGVVIRTMNLIRELLGKGDEVLVVCPEMEGRQDSPVPVAEFPSFPFPDYPEYRIGLPDQKLVEVVRDFKPDVLHYLNPFAFGFRCLDVIQRSDLSIPEVFSFHTYYAEYVKQYAFLKLMSPLLWWLIKDYHNCADINLTVSSITQDDLTEKGFHRVELWPPAVNSELFRPSKATTEMRNRLSDGEPEKPLLLTVSRLAPEKNVAFLADVMRRFPEARLAVVGDGPQRIELERRFAGTSTSFFGYFEGEKLAEAYASADAFLYSSETETLGNVILEAMSSGLPVVAPRAGGIPSLIAHGEDGYLYEPRNLEEAVSFVRPLVEDEAHRRQIGEAARSESCNRSWGNAIDTVRRYYQDTIDSHPSQGSPNIRQRLLAPLAISSLVTVYRLMSWTQQFLKLKGWTELDPSKRQEVVGKTILNPTGRNHANFP